MSNNKSAIKFKAKVVKVGNSYGFTIPKTFFDVSLVDKDKKYVVEIMEVRK